MLVLMAGRQRIGLIPDKGDLSLLGVFRRGQDVALSAWWLSEISILMIACFCEHPRPGQAAGGFGFKEAPLLTKGMCNKGRSWMQIS